MQFPILKSVTDIRKDTKRIFDQVRKNDEVVLVTKNNDKLSVIISPKHFQSITSYLTSTPYLADGKHIKKLTDGYRLRVASYRVFYSERKTPTFMSGMKRRVKPRLTWRIASEEGENHGLQAVGIYYIESKNVSITSIVRRTSTTCK